MNNELTNAKFYLWQLSLEHWKSYEFLTTVWWVTLVLMIIWYIFWWLLVDKRNLIELLLFGSLVCVMRITFDYYAVIASLYEYQVRLLPLIPSPFLHQFTITPLTLIIAYQYSDNWKQFIINLSIATGLITFIMLPTFVWLGAVKFHHWNFLYSFVQIFIISLIGRFVTKIVVNIQNKNKF